MKHILTLTLAAVLVSACAPQAVDDAPCKSITLSIAGVESGTMTKAVADLLTTSAPSSPVTIRLQSKTNANRRYTLTAGSSAVVALDTYTATATYNPQSVLDVWRGQCYTEPSFEVNATLSVTASQDAYTLPASYTCFALVWEKSSTAGYSLWSASGAPTACTSWVDGDGLSLVYIRCTSGWTASSNLIVTATPADDVNFEATQYKLTTEAAAGCVKVDNGKWFFSIFVK